MTIREEIQRAEAMMLSKHATLSINSKGRQRPEPDCDMRTPYQRDRDRIIHSKSFRRLKHKTQVFLSPEGDHYRTRLTHTLEVAQIARTIARALRLNEDLAEAAALGHDLGHTPFGHAGERALDALMERGFKHYEQSVRVVDKLEKDGKGLNLTHEVREGILRHTTGVEAETTEGRIIRWADKIAYINHDIDDAIRADVLKETELPSDLIGVLGDTKTRRITTMITALIEESTEGGICMPPAVYKAYKELQEFMFQAVYLNDYAKSEEKKVPHIMESLYRHFLNPDRLPPHMQKIAEEEGKDVASADYVSGMTDQYAISFFKELYIPKAWDITF